MTGNNLAINLNFGTVFVVADDGRRMREPRDYEGVVEFSRKENAIVIVERFRYDYNRPVTGNISKPEIADELLRQYVTAYHGSTEHSLTFMTPPANYEEVTGEVVSRGTVTA